MPFLLIAESKALPQCPHKLGQLVAELGSHKSSGRVYGVNPFTLTLGIALQSIKLVWKDKTRREIAFQVDY